MPKFIFFTVPSTGHVDPMLPFATELVNRGHELIFYLTEEYREQVEATGAEYRAYQGIGPDYFEAVSHPFNPVRLATQLVETTAQLAPSLAKDIARIQPQAVVYDSMCAWGRVAAEQASVMAVASMALMDLPFRYFVKSGDLPSRAKIMTRGMPWIPRYMQAARSVQQATGVAIPPFVRLLNWPGDHNICYTARIMLTNSRNGYANYIFVGPPVQDVVAEIPFPYEELADDRPLIYASLGTVFNNNPQFFRACLDAFAKEDVQLVVSTGRGVDPGELGAIPDNAIVRDYVPQQAIVQRARLFISHSGANSVHQSLYYGVPLLLVPQQLEQATIATRAAELGAGLILNRSKVTPERIRSLAKMLLREDVFRQRAATLGTALREAGGITRAADALEVLVDSFP